MISFSEYLTEARMAPLYHGTDFDSLRRILISDGIKPTTIQSAKKLLKHPAKGPTLTNDFVGVSLTRSFNFAKNWAFNKTDLLSRDNTMIVLQLDQQKLSQRFEIKPIQYWTSIVDGKITKGGRYPENLGAKKVYNEYEEFVITSKPIPLNYITRIYIDKNQIWKAKELLKKNDKNIEVAGM